MKRVIKQAITGMIVGSMLCSNILAATTTFTDQAAIDKSWAKQYINNVVEKGLMKGTINGTNATKVSFNTKAKMTSYECIITIARMMGSDQADTAAMAAKYKISVLEKYVPAGKRWADKELAFCLEKGIILPSDIKAFANKSTIMKKDIALYIGRALGVKEITGDTEDLPYKDKKLIPKLYVPQLLFLIENGILTVDADGETMFNPGEEMTREVFAKMIDTADEARKKLFPETKPETPTTPDETGVVVVEGVVSEISETSITIKNTNSVGTETKATYKIGADVVCTVKGVVSKPITILVGDTVDLTIAEGILAKIAVKDATVAVDKNTGYFMGYETVSGVGYITIKHIGGTTARYKVKTAITSMDIIKNNNMIPISGFTQGDKIVKVIYENGEIAYIEVQTSVDKGTGNIQNINITLGKPTVITIQEEVTNNVKTLAVSADVEIMVENKKTDVYALRSGMTINYTIISEVLTKIEVGTASTMDKLIAKVVSVNETGKTMIVKSYDYDAKKEVVQTLDISTAIIKIGQNNATLLDIKVGDDVELYIVKEKDKLIAKSIKIIK